MKQLLVIAICVVKVLLVVIAFAHSSFAAGVIVFEGDSIPAYQPYAQGFPALAVSQASLPDAPSIWYSATGGSTMSDVNARAATVDSKCLPGSSYCILVLLIGANDLRGEAWWTFVDKVRNYCNARHAAKPWKILLIPVLPQKTANPFPSARLNANSSFAASTYWDYYAAGLMTDPVMGCASCAFQPTVYFWTDPLPHPTGAGQAAIAPYVAVGLTQLSGGLPVPPAQPIGLGVQILMSWKAVPFATSYRVKGSNVSGGPYTTVATVTSPTYTVTSGAYRFFVVSAVNANGEGPDSAELTLF